MTKLLKDENTNSVISEAKTWKVEMFVVSGIYNDCSKLDKYHFTENHFFSEFYKMYYLIAKGLHKQNLSLTQDNIAQYLHNFNPDLERNYVKRGGWKTVETIKKVLKNQSDFDGYYNLLVKLSAVQNSYKNIKQPTMENIADMDSNELYSMFVDGIESAFSEAGGHNEIHSVGDKIDDLIDRLNNGEQHGLEIGNKMTRLNAAINGFVPGKVYGLGALSGVGKSTIAVNMLANIVIKSNEKVVMIVNEEDCAKVQQEMLLYVIHNVPGTVPVLTKKRLLEGHFSPSEMANIDYAKNVLKKLRDKLVIVSLESYTITEAKRIIHNYAKQGYKYFCLDTFKESLDSRNNDPWKSMMRDANDLADLVKPSNLNVCLLLTYQLSKNSAREQHLSVDNIGQAKSIVDVMSVNLMMRRVNNNEESNLNYRVNQTGIEGQLIEFGKDYLLLFINKNRNGPVLQEPLLYEIDYNRQKIVEKGYAIL